jgi:hypothetical protein
MRMDFGEVVVMVAGTTTTTRVHRGATTILSIG